MSYNLTVNPIVTALKPRNLFSKLTIDPKKDVTANIGSPASFVLKPHFALSDKQYSYMGIILNATFY